MTLTFGWLDLTFPKQNIRHIESIRCWTLSYDIALSTKFKGHFIEASSTGSIQLQFNSTNIYYTWKKVSAFINGLLAGSLWIKRQGNVDFLIIKRMNYVKLNTICHRLISPKRHRYTAAISGIEYKPCWENPSLTLPTYMLEGTSNENVSKSKTHSILKILKMKMA